MRTLLLLLAATSLTATPAVAQHQGHHGQHQPAPAKKKPAPKKPAAKKPAAKKPAAKKPAAKKASAKKPAAKKPVAKKAPAKKDPAKKAAPAKPAADPHAHHQPASPQPDPHAGHAASPQPDPHAGHAMPSQADPHAAHAVPSQGDPHAGHDMRATAVDPPVAPPPAEALAGPEHAADTVWDPRSMAQARRGMRREHGDIPAYRLLVDRLETGIRRGRDSYLLDGEAWYGGDIDKLWLKAEAEGEAGEGLEGAELQALWSHAIDPWFDLQAGVRYDLRRGSDRGHLVAGVQGLAPYWIEIDAAAFLSDRGDVTARLEAEHDARITQQLILQPRAELGFALQDVPRERLGAGLSEIAVGARLRYQLTPLFAPYIGVEYERAIGDSRRFRRLADEDLGGFSLVAGVRTWF